MPVRHPASLPRNTGGLGHSFAFESLRLNGPEVILTTPEVTLTDIGGLSGLIQGEVEAYLPAAVLCLLVLNDQ